MNFMMLYIKFSVGEIICKTNEKLILGNVKYDSINIIII